MLPLEDITVVDFSQRLPGSYCSSILADFGAHVVWVERADAYPEPRTIFPGLMELVSRNKRSMRLNLKSGEGKQIAEKLIAGADVVIEEFRPGVAERLGIGHDRVQAMNPRVVYCSLSGFGQDGPYRDRVGHDINYLSIAGVMSIPGQPEVSPSRPGVPVVDLTAGMFAALSIMGTLRKRDREGKGEYLDVSMLDCMVSWMATRAGRYLVYGQQTENEHLSPLNNVYETKDGKRVSLGMVEQNFWENFCRAMGKEELLADERFATPAGRKRHGSELLTLLRSLVAQYTSEELTRMLNWNEVPYAAVHSMEEALNDPHVQHRNLIQEVEAAGLGRIKEVAFPVLFSQTRLTITAPPPAWGQHTEEILREAGYTDREISSFKEKAAI